MSTFLPFSAAAEKGSPFLDLNANSEKVAF